MAFTGFPAAPPSPQAPPLGPVAAKTSSGWLALVFAVLVAVGGIAPLVSFAGEESGAIVDDSGGAWFIAVIAATAVLGSVAAFRGHATGAALAGGVGLSTALVALMTGRVLQLLAFGGDLSPHVGGVAFIGAGLLGVVLAVQALTLASEARDHHGTAPVVLALLAAIGTGLFIFGLLDPPEGVSLSDHLGGGDGFLNGAAWALVACMAATAVALIASRSPVAAGLLAGQAAIWMFSWAAAATELPQSAFISIPGGTASTAGIGVTLMTAAAFAAAAASAGRPVRHPRAAERAKVQWALPASALIVIGALGAFGISEDQDEFGPSDFDGASATFDDDDFDDFEEFDDFEAFDSFAGEVQPGDSIDGFLDAGEVDVYAVDGDGNQLVVYVDGFGSDTTLTAMSGGFELAYDDDSYGLDPEIVFFPDGSTAIEVRAYHSSDSFSYRIHIDYCCGD